MSGEPEGASNPAEQAEAAILREGQTLEAPNQPEPTVLEDKSVEPVSAPVTPFPSEAKMEDLEKQDAPPAEALREGQAGPGNRKFEARTREHWYQFWRFKGAPPPPPESLEDAPELPLSHTNFFSHISYSWIGPMLFLGYRRPLEATDLWRMDGPRKAETLSEKLIEYWEARCADANAYNERIVSGELRPGVMKRFGWRLSAMREQATKLGGSASVQERMQAKEARWRAPPPPKTMEGKWAEQEPKSRTDVLAGKVKSGHKRAMLTAAMWDIFWPNIYVAYVCKLFADTAYLVSTLLVEHMIKCVLDNNIGLGVGYAVITFVIMAFSNFLSNRFFYESMYTGVFARAALISGIFKRALRMHGRDRSTGKLVNHISTDVSRIDFGAGWWLLTFTAPVEIIVCLVILLTRFGYYCFSGFALIAIVMPLQVYSMKYLFDLRAKSMSWTDRRARRTQEVLSGMRIVKLFSYESNFLKLITGLRRGELKYVFRLNVARAAVLASAISLPLLASVFAIITYVYKTGKVDPEVVFPAITLFQLLRIPLMFLPFGLSVIADGANSFSRLREVFCAEQHDTNVKFDTDLPVALRLTNATFRWDSVEEDATLKPVQSQKQKRKQRKLWAKLRKGKDKAPKAEGKRKRKGLFKRKPRDPLSAAEAQPVDEAAQSSAKPEGKAEGAGVAEENQPFGLENLSLEVKRGELCGIIGPVGSGKSSLLLGALGEMRRIAGETLWCTPRVAYCSQSAWIQNATVRDNIVFGEPWDEQHYWECVERAELVDDLKILQSGDMTEIGERGVTLSGGQKQRVNIARALYYNADVICLDDPLSAVDAHVGKALFNRCILPLRDMGKTVLLVTHAIQYLPQMDRIVSMADGTVEETGTYEELMARRGNFYDMVNKFGLVLAEQEQEEANDADELAAEVEAQQADPKKRSPYAHERLDLTKLSKPGVGKTMESEERNTGAVDAHVYGTYLKSGRAWLLVPVALVFACAMQTAVNLSSYWLTMWQQDHYHRGVQQGRSFYLGIYGMLGVLQLIFNFVLDVTLGLLTFMASQALHDNAITRVIYAPMWWFDTTPLGRVMNRFGKDIDVLDNQLSSLLRQCVSTVMSILGSVVMITYIAHYFIIAVAVVFIFAYFVAQFYRSSAREFKRLDALLRSTLYSHFAEALTGLTTIRSFHKSTMFLKENYNRMDLENRAYLLTITNQRWLGLRLDLAGSFLVLIVGILVTSGATFDRNDENSRKNAASSSGVALSFIVVIAQSLGFLTRQLTELENEMNSAERVVYYAEKLDQEKAQAIPEKAPPPNWPNHGAVEINDVWLRYRPTLPYVLKGISLQVQGGHKVGIVGRTGAGKSSIMTVLLRLSEVASGSVVIDGVDVSQIGLEDLRRRIAILPQEPLLFSGTLRSNLDPFGVYDDARLLDAMHRAYLTQGSEQGSGAVTPRDPEAPGAPGVPEDGEKSKALTKLSLDSIIDEEGANLSVGQRSLVSLARALVKDSKIILLDEATASVDLDTDAKIQKTIRTEFHDRTLLCIAHRLSTIIGYDRVVVMDDGRVAEHDTPLALFDRPDGIFRGMCERSGLTREDIIAAKL